MDAERWKIVRAVRFIAFDVQFSRLNRGVPAGGTNLTERSSLLHREKSELYKLNYLYLYV